MVQIIIPGVLERKKKNFIFVREGCDFILAREPTKPSQNGMSSLHTQYTLY